MKTEFFLFGSGKNGVGDKGFGDGRCRPEVGHVVSLMWEVVGGVICTSGWRDLGLWG